MPLSPSGGARIKSIQRGVIAMGGLTSNTATITAVDTAKAEVRLIGSTALNATPEHSFFRLALTNSTTLTATRNGSQAGTYEVGFEVTEFY